MRICKKEKTKLIWPFFLFFLFPNFRFDEFGIFFLLEEAHFIMKETCLLPGKKKNKNKKKNKKKKKKLAIKKQ
jgi:hypothetical protein